MPGRLPRGLLDRLICPHCSAPLSTGPSDVQCATCHHTYDYVPEGALDLRLRGPRRVHVEYELGSPLPDAPFTLGAPLPTITPDVDLSGLPLRHIGRGLVAHFPKASAPDSLMLDLGAGREAYHRALCERAGFQYVGLDHYWRSVDVLGDAHALPFAAGTFEFILAIAVWEHLRFPLVAIREVARVLKPGGRFIGTVAFLEPFHSDSYFHHSHLGIYNVLTFGGLEVVGITASPEWSVLTAQASMALFPDLPDAAARALVWPLQKVHQAWWWVRRGRGMELRRVRETTGAFAFVATKPGVASRPMDPAAARG